MEEHKCKICDDILSTRKGLSQHVVIKHRLNYSRFKDYYDEFIKKPDEGFCLTCGTDTKYTRGSGYNKFCSDRRCAGEYNRETVSEKVKNSSYHIWSRGKSFDEIRGAEARIHLSNKMKGIFSLPWFIEKYGNDDGTIRYYDRCESISKTSYFNEYNKINKQNYSGISQRLFNDICSIVDFSNEQIYYATLNHEYSCGTKFNFDFVALDRKRVIEFNGDLFHANPLMFSATDTPNPYEKELSAEMIWQHDKHKIDLVISKGYEVLIVWEKDINCNYNDILNKCVSFLTKEKIDECIES